MEPDSLVAKAVQLLTFYQTNLSELRLRMVEAFNESELRNLCFDMLVDYEDLPGSTKGDKARELITWCIRHGRLEELLKRCGQLRPVVFPLSDFTHRLGVTVQQATKVHEIIAAQMHQDAYARATFERLAEQPDSQPHQTALATILVELVEKDPDFAALLETLTINQRSPEIIKQQVQISDQAQVENVNVIGKVQGNVKISGQTWWQKVLAIIFEKGSRE